jgi:hypothetical protein
MPIRREPSRTAWRSVAPMMAAMLTLALLLAACGGGGGGGNNDVSGTLKVAVANKTETEATLQIGDGEPQTMEACKGAVFSFDLPVTDWVLTINGQSAIDSTTLSSDLLDVNIVADLVIESDGSITVNRVQRGANIQPPSSFGLCSGG